MTHTRELHRIPKYLCSWGATCKPAPDRVDVLARAAFLLQLRSHTLTFTIHNLLSHPPQPSLSSFKMASAPPTKSRREATVTPHDQSQNADILKNRFKEMTPQESEKQAERFVDEYTRGVNNAAKEHSRPAVVDLPPIVREVCSQFPTLQTRIEILDHILRLSPHIEVRQFNGEDATRKDNTQKHSRRPKTEKEPRSDPGATSQATAGPHALGQSQVVPSTSGRPSVSAGLQEPQLASRYRPKNVENQLPPNLLPQKALEPFDPERWPAYTRPGDKTWNDGILNPSRYGCSKAEDLHLCYLTFWTILLCPYSENSGVQCRGTHKWPAAQLDFLERHNRISADALNRLRRCYSLPRPPFVHPEIPDDLNEGIPLLQGPTMAAEARKTKTDDNQLPALSTHRPQMISRIEQTEVVTHSPDSTGPEDTKKRKLDAAALPPSSSETKKKKMDASALPPKSTSTSEESDEDVFFDARSAFSNSDREDAATE